MSGKDEVQYRAVLFYDTHGNTTWNRDKHVGA